MADRPKGKKLAFKFNAILNFNSAGAVAGMTRANKGINRMKKNFASMGNNMAKVNQGIRGLAIATAPFTIGVAFASKTAADFEAQMSTVQSVLLASKEEMKSLNAITKQLGATTSFSAKEAGEGAEFLARAGFSQAEVIAALPGVLDAAAAAGVGLGDAANIVAGQLGAFALPASEAANVADSLALTTALTNTNFIELGEAMKFAAPAAKQAGISLAETASAMGILANAGLKGSIAGTALKNAILKLSKPTKESLALFGGPKGLAAATLETVEVNGKLITRLKPLSAIMANVSKVVARAKNPLEAVKKASDIFGIRGSAAFASFQSAMLKTIPITNKNRDAIVLGAKRAGENIDEFIAKGAIPKIVALRLQIEGATGTAKKMAKIKLDNVKGQFVLLQSAVSGTAIELGELVSKPLKNFLKRATDGFALMAVAFQFAKGSITDIGEATKLLGDNQFGGLLENAIAFAQGFIEGLDELKASAISAFQTMSKFLKPIFGDTNLTAKEFGKLAAKVIAIGAVAAPVLAGIAAAVFIIGPIITGIAGAIGLVINVLGVLLGAAQFVFGIIATVVGAVSLPVLAVVAAIVAVGVVLFIFRDEIFAAFSSIGNFILESFQPLFTVFKFIGALATVVFQDIIMPVVKTTSDFIFSNFIEPVTSVFKFMWDGLVSGATFAFNGIKSIASAIGSGIVAVFKVVGQTMFEVLTFPIRAVISLVRSLIKSIAGTALGRKALKIAGIDVTELNKSLDKLPGIDSAAGSVEGDSPAIAGATVKKQALAQSPSAQETGAATASAISSAQAGKKPAEQKVNVVVTGQFKARGKDLNMVVTKSQIQNSELNGRAVASGTKRKVGSNGAQFRE